jgi:hypothetical protein
MWLLSFFFVFISFGFSISQNYFAEFEEALSTQQRNIAANKLNNDFFASIDTPKEIEIFCPGANPIVSIKDLVTESFSGREGECIVIKISGENFSFNFTMNCLDDDL